jgi:hypothetical protein
LTYKRNNLPAADLSQEGIQSLKKYSHGLTNLVTERYALLKFDADKNDFELVREGQKIDYNKKTLLLVHGTFVNTAASFAGLYADEFKPHNTFLQSLNCFVSPHC